MEEVFVNFQYLSSAIDEIKTGKVNVLQSACGTGKTKAIKDFVQLAIDSDESCRITVITFRRSLAIKLSTDFNFESYLRHGQKRKIDPDRYPRVVVSAESLHKIFTYDDAVNGERLPLPRILIIDEFCSLLEHIMNTTTMNSKTRMLFIDFLTLVCRSEEVTVILADAYMRKSRELTLLSAICEGRLDRIVWIYNEYRRPIAHNMIIHHSKNKFARFVIDMITELKDENFFVFSSSKKALESLETGYRTRADPNFKSDHYAVHASMSDYDDERVMITSDSLDSIKEDYSVDPDTHWKKRVIYASPTMASGISFDNKTHFHTLIGWGLGPCSPLAFLQHKWRVRAFKSNNVHVLIPRPESRKNIQYELLMTNDDYLINQMNELEEWTKTKYYQLITNSLAIVGNNIVVTYDKKSVLNALVIYNFRIQLNAKLNFEQEMIDMGAIDNLVFSRAQYETEGEAPAFEVSSLSYLRGVTNDFNWNGTFDDDIITNGGVGGRMYDFLNTWNALGWMGPLSYYTMCDEENRLVFDRSKLAEFIDRFGEQSRQDNFATLFFSSLTSTLRSDVEALASCSYTYDTSFLHATSVLFSEFKVFTGFSHNYANFFGTGTFDVCCLALADAPVNVMTETSINNAQSFLRIRKVLIDHWVAICSKVSLKGLANYCVPLDIVKAEYLSTKVLAIIRKVLDALLTFHGIRRSKCCIDTVRTYRYDGDNRIRFNVYSLTNIPERLLLCVCRLFKKKSRFCIFYPEQDPFKLVERVGKVHTLCAKSFYGDITESEYYQKVAKFKPVAQFTSLENVVKRFIDINITNKI